MKNLTTAKKKIDDESKKKSRCLSLITFLCSSPPFSVSPSLAANRHARGKKTSSLLSVSLTGAPEIELESSSSCCLQQRETRERESKGNPFDDAAVVGRSAA